MKNNKVSQQDALKSLARNLIESGREHDDYSNFCDENGVDPKDLQGELQASHPYGLALIGLDLPYEDY